MKDYILQAYPGANIKGTPVGGRTGCFEVTVNGKKYNGTMTPLNYLSDDQIANVLTYVRNSFGNSGDAVKMEDVKRVRATVALPAANQYE